eukprot:TRINITY_DN9630_c0_g1_i1.p1 TRINITY_DN9630_c0_g1~~TRINITY_DN9630_c0_g1_i1.p1  ORF type:complete len:185 (+),score=9.55 TRINITY_DN9630_c0_g1_i1:37-591(+)
MLRRLQTIKNHIDIGRSISNTGSTSCLKQRNCSSSKISNATKVRDTRPAYKYFQSIPTRWMDNDVYGHVNNVIYYSYFDTIVCTYLIEVGKLDPENDEIVGFVVETSCKFYKPISFPQKVDGALRVAKLGNSSVVYEIGLFGEKDEEANAQGHFAQVWVDKKTNKPSAIPSKIRSALEKLLVST